MEQTRREFMKTAALGAAALTFGGSAKSYGRIMGANDRINFAVIGLHGRASAHLGSIKSCSNAMITHVSDVDARELDKFAVATKKRFDQEPVRVKDFRTVLESKDVDVITIATPEHWHAPMAIMGLQAGKHVYVEKPCSHNPHEGELLVQAQKKYGKLVQMGTQQRSSEFTMQIVKKIHDGVIGKAYFGKAWYNNARKSIGIGSIQPVPEYLDWELWQGPAPRRPYRDNVHPYNWHWFWHWGTGESLNNGTHEVDICRWALGMDFPKRITSSGGKFCFVNDDWEFYDTLVTNFEYDDKMITWEGMSGNGRQYFDSERGSVIYGTTGTVFINRSGYKIFNLSDALVDEYKVEKGTAPQGSASKDSMTDAHFQNLTNAIRSGELLHSHIAEANKTVTMLQLSNIAWKVGRPLSLNTMDGHILDDPKAMELWSREYEKGWEIKI